MIPEPGDANCDITITETFHLQTDNELFDKELKQIEADDQAIQTILFGLPEDIYAAVDSCYSECCSESKSSEWCWQNGNQIRCYNCREVGHYARNCTVRPRRRDAAYLQTQLLIAQKEEVGIQLQKEEYDLMAAAADLDEIEEVNANCILMANLQQASTSGTQTDSAPVYDTDGSAENFLQQPMTNPEDITDPTTAMNMALALMAKAFKLNYSTPTNNNQRISSNPRNRQIAQPANFIKPKEQADCSTGYEYGSRQINADDWSSEFRAEGNAAGHNGNQIRCYNCRGVGHFARDCTARPRRRDAAYLQTQLLIAQKEEAGIQLQVEEYDLMAATADLDEIEEVNANCILMANLQQASSSGIANKNGTGNIVAAKAEGTRNGNQVRCYNCIGLGHIARNCTTRPRRRDAAYLQTQLLIAQKEEAGFNFKQKNLTSWLLQGIWMR
nr:hypothetical protein [Tanacetum cinerariifolium]